MIVTKDGVVWDQEVFDHGLITQFAERFAGKRDYFEVVWEREASMQQTSPQTASHTESVGKLPRPFRQGKYTPKNKNVNPETEKIKNF